MANSPTYRDEKGSDGSYPYPQQQYPYGQGSEPVHSPKSMGTYYQGQGGGGGGGPGSGPRRGEDKFHHPNPQPSSPYGGAFDDSKGHYQHDLDSGTGEEQSPLRAYGAVHSHNSNSYNSSSNNNSSNNNNSSSSSSSSNNNLSVTEDVVNDIFSFARHGRVEEIERLLNRGVPVDVRDEWGNTLLTSACQNGNKRVAKAVLRRGANINARNAKGNTPLHYCFHFGYGDTLGQYIISKGADEGARNNQVGGGDSGRWVGGGNSGR